MELDAKIIDQLREAALISETLTAAYGRGAKSAELQAMAMKRLAAQIEKTTGKSKEEAEAIAKKISDDEKSADRRKKIDDQQVQAIKKFTSDVVGMAKAGMSASQSMYNTDKEFTAAVPTLELMGSAIKSVTAALSGMFSGIPFLGAAVAGLDKLSSVAVDVTTQVAKMQLENAQKYVDTYRALSKVGVTFGGDIEAMREAAARGGLALDQYNKFVTNNIEGLATMGSTLQDAADRVMKMGKTALDTNKKLLTIYGGYEEVNSALAMYASTMSMYGVDTVKNQAALNSGSADYLSTLKTLQAVTGKSAEAYKTDQEKRAKHAAYLMRIQEIAARDPGLAEALKRTVYLSTQMYGEDAGNRLEERIAQSTDAMALNGAAISKSSLQFESFSNSAARATDDMLVAAVENRNNTKAAMIAQAQIIQDSRAGIIADAESNRGIARAAYAANSETIQKIVTNISEQLGKFDKTGNIVEAVNEHFRQFDADQSKGSKGFNSAIESLKDYKIRMDELVAKSLPKVAEMATGLIKLQENLVNTFSDLGGAVDLATGAFMELVGAMNKVLGKSAPPQRAEVGVKGIQDKRQETAINTARLAKTEGYQKFRESKGFSPTGSYGTYSGEASVDEYVKYLKENTQASYDLIKWGGGITGDRAHFDQLKDDVKLNFLKMIQEYGKAVTVTSAARTSEEQAAIDSGKNPKAPPGHSKHEQGLAIDLNTPDVAALDAAGLLKKYGFKRLEGDPVHITAAMAKGGITDGPSLAGEAGPEAVIPLPDGRNIPVKVDNSAVIEKLEEMISAIKDHSDISKRLLQVTQ